jgi:hypothetical protein
VDIEKLIVNEFISKNVKTRMHKKSGKTMDDRKKKTNEENFNMMTLLGMKKLQKRILDQENYSDAEDNAFQMYLFDYEVKIEEKSVLIESQFRKMVMKHKYMIKKS